MPNYLTKLVSVKFNKKVYLNFQQVNGKKMTDKLILNVLMFDILFGWPFCMYFGYATIKYTLFRMQIHFVKTLKNLFL